MRAADMLLGAFVALGTLAACLGLVLLVPLCWWSWGVFVVLMAGGLVLLVVFAEDD